MVTSQNFLFFKLIRGENRRNRSENVFHSRSVVVVVPCATGGGWRTTTMRAHTPVDCRPTGSDGVQRAHLVGFRNRSSAGLATRATGPNAGAGVPEVMATPTAAGAGLVLRSSDRQWFLVQVPRRRCGSVRLAPDAV